MKAIYLSLFSVAFLCAAKAGTYVVDFESPAYNVPPDGNPAIAEQTSGRDGWRQSHNNPPGNADDGYSPYAWLGTTSRNGVLSTAAIYGGAYDEIPDGFALRRDFTGLMSGRKSLTFQTTIIEDAPPNPEDPDDHLDIDYPSHDIFGFTVSDSQDNLLLTVNLVPALAGQQHLEGVNGLWDIYYAFGNDALQATTNAVQSTALNFFSVEFGLTGLRFGYGAGDEAEFFLNGNPVGYDVNDDELKLAFTFNVGNDDEGSGWNHMAIDNIVVTDGIIPEPSVAMLGALGSLALLRRRRQA